MGKVEPAEVQDTIIWGVDATGKPVRVLVTSEGKLIVEAAVTVAGEVDVTDRPTRLLGKVYGNQDVLQQRPTTKELYVQLSHQGVEYDARQIRQLTSSDSVTCYGNVAALSQSAVAGMWMLNVLPFGSQASALQQRPTTNDLLVQLRHAGAEIDPRDVLDRAGRLLGKVSGDQGLLKQVGPADLRLDVYASYVANPSNLDVPLSTRMANDNIRRVLQYPVGTDIDPRQIRQLTANDSVTVANQIARDADGHGQVDVLSTANPPNLDVPLSTRMSNDNIRRVLQYPAGTDIDPRQIRPLTASDVVTVADVAKVSTHKYLAPTSLAAGGTATIWTPATGKAIRLKRVQISVSAATRIDLRWGTTAFESYFLPANGSVVVNFIGTNLQGAVNAALTLYSSAAATVTASADGDEV